MLEFYFFILVYIEVDEKSHDFETLELVAPKFDGNSFVYEKTCTFAYVIKQYV